MIAARRQDADEVYRELFMLNPNACIALGLEDAYIGHSNGERPVAVYDCEACVEIVMAESCMSYEEALEYLEANTIPSSIGQDLPVFVVTKNR